MGAVAEAQQRSRWQGVQRWTMTMIPTVVAAAAAAAGEAAAGEAAAVAESKARWRLGGRWQGTGWAGSGGPVETAKLTDGWVTENVQKELASLAQGILVGRAA